MSDAPDSGPARPAHNSFGQRAAGDRSIIGAMLESNLVAGNQSFPTPLDQLVRGQSITDSCIDWETTEELLREAAGML